jgi:hypothetical protein
MRDLLPHNSLASTAMICARGLALGSLLALGAPRVLVAQTTPSSSARAHKPVHSKRPVATHKHTPPTKVEPTPATPAPVVPAEPELPKWPANQKAVRATVTWNNEGLRIEADNSSLQQILKDVATATGTEIDGTVTDQRIFGAYGPGRVSEVLSLLLQGFGYNVLMVGDQGQGTPRQIVLSTRNGSKLPPAANTAPATDEDADVEEAQPQPRPDIVPTGPPRIPQQAMQMRQMQRQPQPGIPANNPQN